MVAIIVVFAIALIIMMFILLAYNIAKETKQREWENAEFDRRRAERTERERIERMQKELEMLREEEEMLMEEEEAGREAVIRLRQQEEEDFMAFYREDIVEFFRIRLTLELNEHIFHTVLGDDHSCYADIETVFEDGVLGIECQMPGKDDVSRIKEVYYLKNGEEREKLWSDRDFPKVYDGYLYSICLKTIDAAFNNDFDGLVDGILFNGYLFDFLPTTGQLERRIIMSIFVRREQWDGIDIDHIEPKACFKYLKGVSAAKLTDVSPVNPILSISKEDNRFIESKDVETGEGTNLASMDWDDFEHLVRQLFELEFSRNGGEVKVTQASRDGGVDAIIFDPDPLRGGKIVVQAKRYTNTVGVSAVRDLYGTIINEGANSGILITTSDYGADSYEFAKDKPIKLLNSGHLLGLLQKNGLKGYINIAEAKNTLKE